MRVGVILATSIAIELSVILGATSSQELLNNMVARLQRPIWVKSLREHGIPESEVEQICARISDHYVPWRKALFLVCLAMSLLAVSPIASILVAPIA